MLDMADVNYRGDADFTALSEVEKDLYVLLLFSLLRDMEGITHFYTHHAHHLPRLITFLEVARAPNYHAIHDLTEFLRVQAGDSWDITAMDNYLLNMGEEDNQRICMWDREYDAGVEEMWLRVKEYVRKR